MRATSARWAWVEAVLAHGGEAEGRAVLDAVHAGGTFHATSGVRGPADPPADQKAARDEDRARNRGDSNASRTRDVKRLVLYTREACHLCEEALAALLRVQTTQAFELAIVDLDHEAPSAKRDAYTRTCPWSSSTARRS